MDCTPCPYVLFGRAKDSDDPASGIPVQTSTSPQYGFLNGSVRPTAGSDYQRVPAGKGNLMLALRSHSGSKPAREALRDARRNCTLGCLVCSRTGHGWVAIITRRIRCAMVSRPLALPAQPEAVGGPVALVDTQYLV